MKTLKDEHFWPSYVDLMTSLFFVVFVLFVISYTILSDVIETTEAEAKKLEEIKQTVDALMQKKDFFIYQKDYKRYRLAQNIKFKTGKSSISRNTIENDYSSTVDKLKEIGDTLKNIIIRLQEKKNNDPNFMDVSYLMIIAGRASDLGDSYAKNYELSYERALALYNFWKENGIDFDAKEYHDIIDLQISGNGIGGIGRDTSDESKNQCFLIQIVPKISTDNVEASSNI